MNAWCQKRSTRQVGLARALSKLGYCSRSKAAELIRAGRVSLNGKILRNPETPVSVKHDQIAVDGKMVEPQNKNLSHAEQATRLSNDGVGRKGARDGVRNVEHMFCSDNEPVETKNLPWVAPVGRLDKASEGLLLLTNDSEWAARITAPETHLDKTYHVQVGAVADEEFIQALVRGVRDKNGEVLRVKQARRLRAGQKNCWLEIILDEGKNRQIRRMLEAMGVEVLRLVRVAIGPLLLGRSREGRMPVPHRR